MSIQDKIRGSLIGGAAGDALGYPVEFSSYEGIVRKYGKQGITSYEKNPETGLAELSDDTQMTLFTATGLMLGKTRGCLRGIMGPLESYCACALIRPGIRCRQGSPSTAMSIPGSGTFRRWE